MNAHQDRRPRHVEVAEAGWAHDERAPVRVVFAEDNDSFREGMVKAFERHPGVVLVAVVVDGRAALEAARALRPDLLVLDNRMPRMSGLQVAAMAAHDPALDDTRVVLLTAWDDEATIANANAVGVAACIDKAKSRRRICELILAHLDRADGAA